MSSEKGDQKMNDVEMVDIPSVGPPPSIDGVTVPPLIAEFLAAQEDMVARDAAAVATIVTEHVPANASPVTSEANALGSSSNVATVVKDSGASPESRPVLPPPRELVLGLAALSAKPFPKAPSRKRPAPSARAPPKKKCAKASPLGVETSAGIPTLRAKFVSLIDGMLDESGAENERLRRECEELRAESGELRMRLESIGSVHASELARSEAKVVELERDLGKTTSAWLKEKKARKAKASELRLLQKAVETDESSLALRASEIADGSSLALRNEAETRLANIASSLGALASAHSKDMLLAALQGATGDIAAQLHGASSSREIEEARISAQIKELQASEGEFEAILEALKANCFLPLTPGDLERRCLTDVETGAAADRENGRREPSLGEVEGTDKVLPVEEQGGDLV